MAAALSAVREAGGWARERFREIADDPIRWLVRVTRLIGALFLGIGLAIGVVGFYVKNASVTAQKDELALLSSMSQIWNNLSPITFTPSSSGTAPVFGANPIQDLENFANDVKVDVFALGSDVASAAGTALTAIDDVAKAITDVGATLFSVGAHAPQLLWNALVWGVGGAAADVMNWVFPYLIIFGAILVAISIGLDLVHRAALSYWESTVRPSWEKARATWSTRQRTRFWDPFFAKLFHQRAPGEPSEAEPELVRPVQAAPARSVPIARRKTRPEPAPAVVGRKADAAKASPSPPEASERAGTPSEPEDAAPHELGEPTRAVEAQLGTDLERAKDRLRAAMAARSAA